MGWSFRKLNKTVSSKPVNIGKKGVIVSQSLSPHSNRSGVDVATTCRGKPNSGKVENCWIADTLKLRSPISTPSGGSITVVNANVHFRYKFDGVNIHIGEIGLNLLTSRHTGEVWTPVRSPIDHQVLLDGVLEELENNEHLRTGIETGRYRTVSTVVRLGVFLFLSAACLLVIPPIVLSMREPFTAHIKPTTRNISSFVESVEAIEPVKNVAVDTESISPVGQPPFDETVKEKQRTELLLEEIGKIELELERLYSPREWKSADGKSATTATLLQIIGDQVELKKSDGKVITIPIDKLCDDDRLYCEAFASNRQALGDQLNEKRKEL